jgi:hypothetical protein
MFSQYVCFWCNSIDHPTLQVVTLADHIRLLFISILASQYTVARLCELISAVRLSGATFIIPYQCCGSVSMIQCLFTPWIQDEFFPDPGSGTFFQKICLHYLKNPCFVIFFTMKTCS